MIKDRVNYIFFTQTFNLYYVIIWYTKEQHILFIINTFLKNWKKY